MAAAVAASWALHCKRCEGLLAPHDHVEFLQEGERAVHLALNSDRFREDKPHAQRGNRVLQSKCPKAAITFTKTPQTRVGSLARKPFEFLCPGCQGKVGSEVINEEWRAPAHLFDAKACRVKVREGESESAALIAFKKLSQLLRQLQERQLPHTVRCPTEWSDSSETSDCDDDYSGETTGKVARSKRTKHRRGPLEAHRAPMVCPTAEMLRDHLSKSPDSVSKLRDYQLELVIDALLANSIIYLPTGFGKTLVAIKVATTLKSMNPKRKAVILVPTVPLVSQQASYLRRESKLKVEELAGQRAEVCNRKKRQQRIEAADALIATPQFFLNRLESRELSLEQFCVLVFDEAHHATGDHPYSDILKKLALIEHEHRPRVLALTASPFGQKVAGHTRENSTLRSLCNQYNASLNTPTIRTKDLELDTLFKQVEWASIDDPPEALRLQKRIGRHLGAVRDILNSLRGGSSDVLVEDSSLFRFDSDQSHDWIADVHILCGKLRRMQERLTRRGATSDRNTSECAPHTDRLVDLLMHMRRLLMTLPKFAIYSALTIAGELSDYFERMSEKEPLLFKLIEKPFEQFLKPVLSELTITCVTDKVDVSAKVRQIARIIEESKFDQTSRAIVFVNRRSTAIDLASAMSKIPVLQRLSPTRFVGHNSYQGMSWEEEQKPTLDHFRRGRIRLLVATSVLEEGLDVPGCSLVIRFDGFTGMTSLVQSRGRARQSQGRFVVFCGKKSRDELEKMVASELELMRIARAEAAQLSTKPITASVLDALECGDAMTSLHTIEKMGAPATTSTKRDWSNFVRKFCTMVGIVNLSDTHARPTENQLEHIVEAIHGTGIVEVREVETNHGLIALEPTGEVATAAGLESDNYKAYYDAICQIMDFQVVPVDAGTYPWSFWIKHVTHTSEPSTFHATGTDDYVDETVNAETSLRCLHLYRGWFVDCDTFEPLEEAEYSSCITNVKTQSKLLILDVGDAVRWDFDLCATHNGVVWIESTSPCSWILYLTLHNAPKLWDSKQSSRLCADFHMKSLSFALHLQSKSSVVITVLRKSLSDQGIVVRDTKLKCVDRPMAALAGPIPVDTSSGLLSYMVRSLTSTCSFAFGKSVPGEVLEMVKGMRDDNFRVQALLHFEPSTMTPHDLVTEFRHFVDKNYHVLNGLGKQEQPLVLKAFVTPSRIIFDKPEVAPSNRVFRNHESTHFLYVYFRDENRERLDFSSNVLAQRVRSVLHDGIYIGDCHYQFLGCSLSQLRNGSCIFTALNPQSVRDWIGELSEINPPAKYLKRLGQAFSSTRETFEVHPYVLTHPEKDIENDSYTFTDGCGELTPQAARMVASELNLQGTPSAFQIRLGGAKGVLVVSDFEPSEVDSASDMNSCQGGHLGVRLRKSMVKFRSPHNTLEIVAVASPHSQAYLTRQSIVILSDLGIADDVFLQLQDEYVASLAEMVVSDSLGLKELRAGVPPEQAWWISVLYGGMVGDKMKLDPFHRNVIQAVYQYKLTNTALRARIPIVKGRNLMGVADFTGTLQYGEIFVQYTERDESGDDELARVVVLSDIDVLVHRSPCHHPGDVRVLRCRSAEGLPVGITQLKDCVVFPTRGSRPHPDECTGGDLDGDVFSVIWDERLIPPRSHIWPPMNVKEIAERQVGGDEEPVDVSRLIEFYLYALANDVLGIASNAHLAVSDNDRLLGCKGRDSLVLAHVCALEVDSNKSARHLELVKELSPPKYPDFMDNPEKAAYKSKKVLGRMYRRVLSLMWLSANANMPAPVVVDESFLTEGYREHVRRAKLVYDQYKLSIRMLLNMSGAVSEAELATGMIVKPKTEYMADYFRFGERCRDAYYNNQKKFLALFQSHYGRKPEAVQRRVAAAWYVVAYSDRGNDRCLSFPWILIEILLTNRSVQSRDKVQIPRAEIEPSAMELVESRLQLNILNEIQEREDSLLMGVFDRLEALTALRLALAPHFGDADIGCTMFGSSGLLTFDKQSDLDVVLREVRDASELQAVAQFAKNADNISGVRIHQLKQPREGNQAPTSVLTLSIDSNWSVDISTSRSGPAKTALFRAYMKRYPFFWPAVFFLIKWGKSAGLIRRRSENGEGTGESILYPIGFLWLFLQFCIDNKFVSQIPPTPTHPEPAPVVADEEMSFWSSVVKASQESSAELSAAHIIVAFLAYFGDLSTPLAAFSFTDPYDSNNDTRLEEDSAETFRQQCYNALHLLVVTHGDLIRLLRHNRDRRCRITLSRALSKRIHASPEFFAAKMLRESGALSGTARLSFKRHPNVLRADLYVVDLLGDSESVHLVERHIEKIEEQLGAPQTRRSNKSYHHSGCCLLLFEGAPSQKEQIGFQQYFRDCHRHHADFKLHQAHLISFSNGNSWMDHAISSFTSKFLKQMVKLSQFEKLNPGHGSAKAIIRFGHHYLIHLPFSFHEETITLATIELLEQEFERGREARELYESVLVARQRGREKRKARENENERNEDNSLRENGKWSSFGELNGGGGTGDGRPPERRAASALEKAISVAAKDRGVAHSFYSKIDATLASLLESYALEHKRMEVASTSESYQVSIVHDGDEFNVRLTVDLQMVKVRTRPCRWFSATLKMRQELVDDRSSMDATPDVRYYVSSTEDVPASDDLPLLLERACGKAKGRRGVLRRADDGRLVVSSELLAEGVQPSDVTSVRHIRCTTYRNAADGLDMRVQHVVEYGAPDEDGKFLSERSKTEAEIVMPPLSHDKRVDAGFAQRFLTSGVELVAFLKEKARFGMMETLDIGEMMSQNAAPSDDQESAADDV